MDLLCRTLINFYSTEYVNLISKIIITPFTLLTNFIFMKLLIEGFKMVETNRKKNISDLNM